MLLNSLANYIDENWWKKMKVQLKSKYKISDDKLFLKMLDLSRKTTGHCSADVELQRDSSQKFKFGSTLHRSHSWNAEEEYREEIEMTGDRKTLEERTDAKNKEKDNNSEEGAEGWELYS